MKSTIFNNSFSYFTQPDELIYTIILHFQASVVAQILKQLYGFKDIHIPMYIFLLSSLLMDPIVYLLS